MTDRPARRTLLHSVGAVALLGAAGVGGHHLFRKVVPPTDPQTHIPLYSQTVAMGADGRRALVGAPGVEERHRRGTRLLDDVDEDDATSRRAWDFHERAFPWLRDVPADLAELADAALRDLWVLSDGLAAPVAAWTPYWRYVWPRDAAFCAVALARVGHADRALDALVHLQSLQRGDGWFEARYVPGAAETPDDRPRQFDGTGLVLWAVADVLATLPSARRDRAAEALAPLIETSEATLVDATRGGTILPPISPDYWERREQSVTLGVLAATLAGLAGAHRVTGADASGAAEAELRGLTAQSFGARGFQRYRSSGGADSARAFFAAMGCDDVVPAQELVSLRDELARPAGGIAPGARWRDDGISWTPSTSLLALGLARSGEGRQARDVLHWLDAHRTDAGSLPEKVLFDGSPAAVAPLAWTAANVLLAIDALR